VKFSCKFTLKEIEARWQALLYDKHISKLAMQAVQALQPGVLVSESQSIPWSEEEESLLSTVPSTHLGELKTFQTLLEDNVSTFHLSRSPRALQYHWALMRHFCLLCDQDVGYIPADVNLTSFNEWEEEVDDSELMKPRTQSEEALDHELVIADRKAKREIAFLEKDIQKWEQVLGIEEYHFPPGVLAVFKGQSTAYEMKTKEITIGRGSLGGEKVDIDLMHEMPNNKVSRKQAVVKFDKNGDLVLKNIGRRPVYVHGRPVLTGQSTKLEHRQIVEICNIVLTVYMKQSSPQEKEEESTHHS
jgi:microspherule protein 1